MKPIKMHIEDGKIQPNFYLSELINAMPSPFNKKIGTFEPAAAYRILKFLHAAQILRDSLCNIAQENYPVIGGRKYPITVNLGGGFRTKEYVDYLIQNNIHASRKGAHTRGLAIDFDTLNTNGGKYYHKSNQVPLVPAERIREVWFDICDSFNEIGGFGIYHDTDIEYIHFGFEDVLYQPRSYYGAKSVQGKDHNKWDENWK